MKSTLTMYEVCNNENGGPFNPVSGFMTPNKREALAEPRKLRTRYSNLYLAEAAYTRCPEQKKGW